MNYLAKTFIKISMILAALLWGCIALASGQITAPVAGEVTLAIGRAWISGPAGDAVRVTMGLPVHAGDVIETDANGHVHIRFVDNELLSVRPASILEIVRYDYNAQNPQNSAIKFNLVEGVVRAVSGEAAKHARQNFRMNTPIAAIGVRGTDFAVSASAQSVRAIVNEGAIVVAPFSALCSAESFGPCSQDAVELSGLSRQVLEVSASSAGVSSALLPPSAPRAQALAAAAAAVSSDEKASKSDTNELYADTVTVRVVNTTLASGSEAARPAQGQPAQPAESVKPDPVTPVEVVKPAEPVKPIDPVKPVEPPVVVQLPEFTPPVALAPAVLTTARQLVWGRWVERNLDSARISVSYDVAIENGRKVTVGNLQHALFRVEPAGKSMQPGLGILAFNLTKAQAHYKTGGQIDLMQVNGGELQLDLTQQRFSTQLQLSHAATGSIVFSGAGNINEEGVFHNNTALQSMAGAVSFDGKEAGYFFEKTLNNGSIEGLTLWNVKP